MVKNKYRKGTKMKTKIPIVIAANLLLNLGLFSTTWGQSISFTSPTNGGTYGILPGQSTVTIAVRFSYLPSPVATTNELLFNAELTMESG